MIDIILLVIFAVVSYLVAAEGAWGAVTGFLSTVLAGLLATSYFEELAAVLQSSLGYTWATRVDVIAFLGLFAVLVTVFRLAGEKIQPTDLLLQAKAYDASRVLCGLAAGYVVTCIVTVALHLAPLPREYLGFVPERANLFGVTAPDRQWLGYAHALSAGPYRAGGTHQVFDGDAYSVLPGSPAEVWPSLPIRYAARRQSGGRGGVSSARRQTVLPSTGSQNSARRRPPSKGF